MRRRRRRRRRRKEKRALCERGVHSERQGKGDECLCACMCVCMDVSAPLLLGGQGAVPGDEALVLVLVLAAKCWIEREVGRWHDRVLGCTCLFKPRKKPRARAYTHIHVRTLIQRVIWWTLDQSEGRAYPGGTSASK